MKCKAKCLPVGAIVDEKVVDAVLIGKKVEFLFSDRTRSRLYDLEEKVEYN